MTQIQTPAQPIDYFMTSLMILCTICPRVPRVESVIICFFCTIETFKNLDEKSERIPGGGITQQEGSERPREDNSQKNLMKAD